MPVNPFYSPKFRAFDSNGNPLAGGLLYTYSAGTTTPRSTYTTRAGNVANANPVVLDANGEADVWLTPGVDYKFELHDSSDVLQWTVDNVPSPAATDTTSAVAIDPGGRLSLTSGTPVTTSDVTGATTIYYMPYKSDKVPLYDGNSWTTNTIASELSQTTTDSTKSPAAVANNSNYDMFVWDDSGTLRLSRGPAWSSDTARGTGAGTTELEQINGRYVNKVSITNGPAAQHGLYVGTVRSDGSAQINDSMAKRHVWNAHNRRVRPMSRLETADTWNYAGAIRQANGNAANQLDFVIGLSEDAVFAQLSVQGSNGSGSELSAFLGLDSISTAAPGSLRAMWTTAAGDTVGITATYRGLPGIGRHYLAWLEYGTPASVVQWKGDDGGAAQTQSGINGEIWG